jgi:hypothetical protein
MSGPWIWFCRIMQNCNKNKKIALPARKITQVQKGATG